MARSTTSIGWSPSISRVLWLALKGTAGRAWRCSSAARQWSRVRATTVYYCAISLDGYLAEVDDSLDWLLNYQGTFEHQAAEPDRMSEGGGYEHYGEMTARPATAYSGWSATEASPRSAPTRVSSTRCT